MRVVKIVVETDGLNHEEEENLINDLDDLRFKCVDEFGEEIPVRETFEVTPLEVNDESLTDKDVFGRILIQGYVTDAVLAEIYKLVENLPTADNDPLNLNFDRALMNLIKMQTGYYAENPDELPMAVESWKMILRQNRNDNDGV